MPPIDLSNISAHALNDRKIRIQFIEKTIGIGSPCLICQDPNNKGCVQTLTSTGVLIVRNKTTNMIITMFIATATQAVDVCFRATGHKVLPSDLWDMVNYNNNTPYWKEKTVA